MKTKSAWLFIAVMGLAAACSEDEEKNSITSDDAAAIVAVSLSSNGINSVTSTSAQFASDAMDGDVGGRVATCGFSETLDLSTSSEPGAINPYSFDFEYKFELTCEGEAPAALAVVMNYNGDFSSSDYSYDCSGLADLQIDGLHSDASAFTMNGEYKYDGSFIEKAKNRTISSNVAMTLTDISISKSLYQITSGKGSYSISGSVPSKGSFKYTGEIKFLGAGKAEVSVNGVVYVADMNIGTATKK
jgi:hypothetical protein